MTHGATVRQFEAEFARFVGARYAIACANGTVTLQAALIALGVKPGDRVAVPPLTMAATSIAVLNVGAVPVFVDVMEHTWLMAGYLAHDTRVAIPVSLYGLNYGYGMRVWIDDAAQTLRRKQSSGLTSYSLQSSKILQTGEGGMLVTDDEALAAAARSYLSLGYDLRPDQPRIDATAIKRADAVRHVRSPAINGRMNDATAALGLERLAHADALLAGRRLAASFYADAIAGCDWLTPQFVPKGWTHDYWTFAVACDTPARARALQDAVVAEGGEMPYAAWRLTYHEPAFRHLNPRCAGTFIVDPAPGQHVGDLRMVDGSLCPVAESLQPRILQMQTNDRISADRNARALRRAISRCEGRR